MASTSFTILLKDRLSNGLSKIGQMGSKTFGKLDRLQNRVNEKLSKGADNAGKLANKMSLVNQRGQKSNAIFSKLGGILGGLLMFGGISSLANGIVDTTAKFEKFDAVLTNTLGSKTEATKSMLLIQDFASKTPFGIDELTGSFVKLTNRGLQPNVKQMTQLGDLASSVGKSYDQLTEAMLDAVTGEFERLKEFGIKANKQGNQVKFTFKGVTKTVGFTEKAMRDYILSLGDLKGVQGSMAAISQTLGGKISNLKDKYVTFQKTLGEALRPVMIKVIGSMGKMLEFGERLIKWFSKNQKYILPFVKGLGLAFGVYAAFTAAQWALNFAMAANPIMLLVLGIGALVGSLIFAYKHFSSFRNIVDGFFSSLMPVATMLKKTFVDLFNNLSSLFSGGGSKVQSFGTVLLRVFSFITQAVSLNMRIFGTLLNLFLKPLNWIVKGLIYLKTKFFEVGGGLDWLKDKAASVSGFISEAFGWLSGNISKAYNFISGIINRFVSKFDWLKISIQAIKTTVRDVFNSIADYISKFFGKLGNWASKILNKLGISSSLFSGFSLGNIVNPSGGSNNNQDNSKGGLFSGISNTVNSLSQAGNTPGLAATAGIAGVTGGAASRNITINIDTLAKIEYRNQTVKESASNLTEQIKQVLLTAVNDVNLVQ